MSYKDDNYKQPYIVGIGASAGGILALRQFFENMPDDSGMTFVVVQHLSPDYKSLMGDILSKHTMMKVYQAEEGMRVEPDSVYLIPPKKLLTLSNGLFHLTELNVNYQLNLAIDVFFQSLAQNSYEKAIGIILSGAGNDGTRGATAIKEAGGMVMVQDEYSAQFVSMPQHIISAGVYDYILPPTQMGQKLMEYISQRSVFVPDNEHIQPIESTEDGLWSIYPILKKYSGIDFSLYKKSILVRCIDRRVKILQLPTIQDYIEYMYKNPGESALLHNSALINVTKFFRDQEVFNIIAEQIVPEICEGKDEENPLRVWVPGCSTGEEVYSLAILVREHIEAMELNIPVKIFATDINKQALDYAAAGIYPESIAVDVSSDRLSKYFVKTADSYQISKLIRNMVIFSQHNVISDPPFNKLDFLSCRNLFIYLKPVIQRKILTYFHFALDPGGYLLLGSSETIGDLEHYFSVCNGKWRIYRSNTVYKSPLFEVNHVASTAENMHISRSFEYVRGVRGKSKIRMDEIQTSLIEAFMPSCIIIDRNNEPIYTCGDANKYLQLPSGSVSLDINKMVTKDLSILLGTAINKIRKQQREIVYRNIKVDQSEESIDIHVKPFTIKQDHSYIAITFEPIKAISEVREYIQKEKLYDAEETMHARIHDLEYELMDAKECLQETIEEMETSGEELQSTNEELLAANEELQSTNEELHSVNEELITVNAQYVRKIQELTELNNDMNNFLSSTNIGTIFLDKNLLIRRFTPAVKKEINLMDIDIGRPLHHISHKFKNINLVQEAKEVLATLMTISKEVESIDGNWYVLRFIPYRTDENVIKGIVMTLVEVTELKRATDDLRKLSQAIEQSSSVIVITDSEGYIEYVNANFTKVTGYTSQEVMQKTLSVLKSGVHSDAFYEELWETIRGGATWKNEFCNRRKDGSLYWESTTISPVKNADGIITNYIAIKDDTSQQKEMLDTIKSSEEKFRQLFDNATDAILLYGFNAKGSPNRIIEVNHTACEILGYPKRELLEMSLFDLVSEELIVEIPKMHQKLLTCGDASYETAYTSIDGRDIPFEVNSHVFMLNDEKVVLSIARDITERLRNQELQHRVEIEEKRLKETLEYDQLKTEFFSNLSHELRTPLNVILATLQLFEHSLKEATAIEKSKVPKHLGILKQNCYRLLRIVNNLIDITKIDAGFFEVNLQNNNIVSIVEEITLSVGEYIENKSISLIFDTDVEEKIIPCDPDQIERIMLNLLSNSVKFTKPGGEIVVRIYDFDQKIRISIKDTGIGIPNDKLGIIFERFRQVDKSFVRNHEGSGIGLSLVQSLVEMHGGSIRVESTYGEGCEFIIELPAVPALQTSDTVSVISPISPWENNASRNIERICVEFSDIYS